MQRKKLIKELLHKQNKIKRAAHKTIDKQDDHLELTYVPISEIKGDGATSAFNIQRQKNVETVLNKFIHPDSQHIRLKPYYDAHVWLHWLGVVSDLTLPNNSNNLNGEILIDKLTTGDFKELLDYHVWLNLERVKYVRSKKQKIGIGDFIAGCSQVISYGAGKFGLGATVIKRAGIFQGKNQAEELVGHYDRQDDWVLEIDNSSASNRAWLAYQDSGDRADLVKEPGHVEVRYQPSRYQHYRDRLKKLKREKSDVVLPLVAAAPATYYATVNAMYAVKSPNVSYRLPQLQLRDVRDEHQRLITAQVNLPYAQEMKKVGELQVGEHVSFESFASPNARYLFGSLSKFKVEGEHNYIQLPDFPNTFLGYLMWRNPDEKTDPSLIMNYQNWALARGIHRDEIKKEIDEATPTGPLTEEGLAACFHVKPSLIKSAYDQGIIHPLDDKATERRYDLNTWKILLELLAAQDPHSIQTVKEHLNVYSVDDLAAKFKLTADSAQFQIRKAGYLPLNGFHYKVNLYGPKVYDMFATMQAAKAKLPPKNNIRFNKKIPRDVDYTTHFIQQGSKQDVNTLPIPVREQIHHEKEAQGSQRYELSKLSEGQLQRIAKAEKTHEDKAAIRIETVDGSYLDLEFKDFTAADKYIEETANVKLATRFLHVTNIRTGERELISTKAITSFRLDN